MGVQLIKAMQHNQFLDMMYMAKDGTVTKRRIKIIKVAGDSFQAFCLLNNAKRTYIIDNVLVIAPVAHKEGWVV